MDISNKEVMDKLQDYLLTQDPKIVARAAASLMVDMNRIYSIDSLPIQEALCLRDRIERNVLQIRDFLENGTTKNLKIIPMNSDES